MRLTKKLCLLFIIGWFLPILFSSYYIYLKITDNLIDSQIELAKEGHQQVESFLSYHLERVTLTSSIIAMDSMVNGILTRSPENYTYAEQLKDMSKLKVYLEQFQSVHNRFDILRLYVPDGRVYSNENKLFFNLENAKDTLWYKNSFRGWGWTTYNPPVNMEKSNAISVVRPIRDLNDYRNIIGAVRIDIPLEEIERMLSRSNVNSGCLTYLATDNDVTIGASSYQLLPTYTLTNGEKKEANSIKDTFVPLRKNGEKIWTYVSNIEPINWSLVTVLPEKELINGIHTLQWQYIITITLLFFIVILINMPYINSIPKRLNQLVNNMKRVQQGDLSASLYTTSRDEIGQLIDNFNFMLESIKELMDQQYILGQEIKTAELKALQSQINPHFLYNTLEMIGWLAYEGNPTEIHSVVSSLAKFFRFSLNQGNDITTIDHELQLVKNYMHIQDFRFRNRIKLLIDVKDIHNFAIPKITLQPIVENAIIHGILEKTNKQGTIKVLGRLNPGDMIELSVIDDGVGMNTEQLDKIITGELSLSDEGGYGLNNIEKRICLFFGIERALFYQSQLNKGTKVTLLIPAIHYT